MTHPSPTRRSSDLQEAPFLNDIPGRLGKAVSGHVDEPEHQRRADVEIVEFLRPPRSDRGARQPIPIGQRVEQRRFADVRPARERNLRSEEHTSELPSTMRITYRVFCLKQNKTTQCKINKP